MPRLSCAVMVLVLMAGAALCQLDINVPLGQGANYKTVIDGGSQSDQRSDSYRSESYQQRVDDYQRADYYQQQQRTDQRILTFSATQRISHANVLLPQTVVKNKVRYTLHTANGCFKWTNSNPDELAMDMLGAAPSAAVPEPPAGLPSGLPGDLSGTGARTGCSAGAVLSPQSSPRGGRTALSVTAEDLASGNLLRCEVFLDQIVKLGVLTTTRTMYRDNIERIEVQAFDAEGNVFSSVEGLHFQWRILPVNPTDAAGVLTFVSFKDSGVEASARLLELEAARVDTSAKLVQGIEVGKATVQVRLLEPEYAHVPPASAVITVLEPLELRPATAVYVPPGAAVQYSLLTLKRAALQSIELPSPQYRWLTSNGSVAEVDQAGLLTALQVGDTDVRVQSVNISDNEVRGAVHVVFPGHLGLAISPHGAARVLSTYLITQHLYDLEVEVFDREGHRLFGSDNLRFSVQLEPAHLGLVNASESRGQSLVRALELGPTPVHAQLEEYRVKGRWFRLPAALSVRADVVVTAAVRLVPDVDTLALPVGGLCRQQLQLGATGGSGEYVWYSHDPAVVSVSATGLLAVHAVGEALVQVLDKKNPANLAAVRVSVVLPAVVEFLPERLEAQLGYPIFLAYAARDAAGRAFANCTCLSLDWSLQDPAVFSLLSDNATTSLTLPPLPAGACGMRTLLALKEGHTSLAMAYSVAGRDAEVLAAAGGRKLRDEITLFAFAPLVVMFPPEQGVSVTLGATAPLEFEGGPAAWQYDAAAFSEEISSDLSGDHVAVARVHKLGGRRQYRVTCLRLGDQQLTVRVGNRPTATNRFPASRVATARFFCRVPATVVLYPLRDAAALLQPGSATRKCLDAVAFPSWDSLVHLNFATPSKYQLRNDRRLPFNVTLLDDKGMPFYNHSSVLVRWTAANASLGRWLEPSASADPLEGRRTRPLQLSGAEGTLLVAAEAFDYDAAMLRAAPVAAGYPALRPIERELELVLLGNVRFQPAHVTIYNHERNVYRLLALGGSGAFQFSANDSLPGSLATDEHGAHVDVVPRAAGTLRVVAHDLCLEGAQPAYAVVRVADVQTLELKVRDMLLIGSGTQMEVTAFDDYGEPLLPSQYAWLNLSVVMDNEVLDIRGPVPGSHNRYQVRGVAVGSSRVSVTTRRRSGSNVSSKTKQVYVYAPLKLHPPVVTLLPDAVFQVSHSGGPPVRAELHLRIANSTVADTTPLGLLTAHAVGSTVLTGVMEGFDGDERVTYGEDSVQVHVRLLSGIRVHTPLTQLDAGTEMTVRAAGLEGETPFTFGGVPALAFEWSVANHDVVALAHVYAHAGGPRGASLPASGGPGVFAVRTLALHPGTTRVTLRVSARPGYDLRRYVAVDAPLVASAVVQVREPLAFSSAPLTGCQSRLLLPPFSRYLLATNKSAYKRLAYHVLSHSDASDGALVEVGERGLVQARARPGVALVAVRDEEDAEQLAVQVHVKPLAAVQLLPAPAPGALLPLGGVLEFTVKLQDERGHVFDSADGVGLAVQCNNPDVVANMSPLGAEGSANVSQVVLQLKALRAGDAIVRISLSRSEHLDDYISVRVTNAIVPLAPVVHAGGQVQFAVTFADAQSSAGGWRSDDESIMTVNARTGLADALRPGRVNIFNSGTLNTFVTVEVVKVAEVELDTRAAPQLTNLQADAAYYYPVRFYDAARNQLSNAALSASNPVAHQVAYVCSVDAASAAWAYATKEHKNGVDYCVLHPLRPDFFDIKTAFPTSLLLQVSARDRTGRAYDACTRTFTLPFMPGFVLRHKGEVQFSPRLRKGTVEVLLPPHKPNQLLARSSDPALVEVRELKGALLGLDAPDVLRFELAVLDDRAPFHNVVVSFTNPATDQHEQLSVSYVRDEPAPDTAAQVVPTPAADSPAAAPPSARSFSAIDWLMLPAGLLVAVVWIALVNKLPEFFSLARAAEATTATQAPAVSGYTSPFPAGSVPVTPRPGTAFKQYRSTATSPYLYEPSSASPTTY